MGTAFLEIIVSFAFRRVMRPAYDDAVFGQTVYRDDFCMNGERGLFYAEKISSRRYAAGFYLR